MNGADRRTDDASPEDQAETPADAATQAAAPDAAEADADVPPAGEEGASGWEQGPDYEAVIGALQDELEQARDQRMRAAAEMENLRRRTAREVADAKKFAVSGFARDLLSVSDNLTRALAAVTDDEKGAASEVWKNLLEGVEMTERELLSVLDKNGVKKIVPEGERFDPNQHQAMFEVPDPSQPSGMVTQVVAAGFMIGDRVLRPAMVGVTKGGPKPDKADAPATDEPGTPAETGEPGETVDKSA